MRSIIFGPPGLIFLAALIGGAGAFWAAIRQHRLQNQSEGNAVKQLELLQDLSARTGNQKELEELIRARSRALNADRNQADGVAAGIIERLPSLTAEYKAIEENKQQVYETKAADFRLKWQPLIDSCFAQFDSLVAGCRKRGIALEVSREGAVLLTAKDGPNVVYGARRISFHNVDLLVRFMPINFITNGQNWPLQLTIKTGDWNLLALELTVDEGYCRWGYPNEPDSFSGHIAAPKDGIPPKQFSASVEQGVTKVFERYLVMAKAAAETAPTTQSR